MNDPKAGDKKTSTPAHSGFSVRMLEAEDIAALTPVLREHVRDLHSGQVVESEVNAIQSYMQGAADEFGRTRRYLVAFNAEGTAIGCMALAVPEERMAQHFAGITGAPGTTSVELLNAFVATAYLRGQGIGRMLLEAICRMGAADGAHTLLINSGPRYRHSWTFYDRVCDSSHGFIDDYYGEGRHAKTWLKDLRTFA